jgi:hypothetical protein
MALSEHEEKLLQEMEKALYAEDPRFATNIRSAKVSGRKISGIFALVSVFGAAGVVAGLASQMPLVGILGFAVTLFGLYKVVTGVVSTSKNEIPTINKKSAKPKKGGFLKSAADRFEQRREGDNDQNR